MKNAGKLLLFFCLCIGYLVADEYPGRQMTDFLKDYYSSEEKKEKGWSEIAYAALKGENDIARKLLKHGADPNQLLEGGSVTPFTIAIQKGNLELVEMMLNYRANANLTVNQVFDSCMPQVKSSLYASRICGPDVYSPLMVAIQSHHPEIALLLIEYGADPRYESSLHYQPLHLAVRHHQAVVLNKLFEKGVEANSVDVWGYAPLHYCAFMNSGVKAKEIGEILIDHGANVNQKIKSPIIQSTPLHLAAYNGHVDFVQLLIARYADVSSEDHEGSTPLWKSVSGPIESRDIVKGLIQAGANVDRINYSHADADQTERLGMTALGQAILTKKYYVADLLLENRADVELPDAYGRTALLYAVGQNDPQAIDVLLKHGANPANPGRVGNSPIDFAQECDSQEIVDKLIQAQAKKLER